ncbi:hypothetical protein [Spirillospora sp. NBC_01491]|uniref:hypothetical protein n=1 Tax=Spirillospora sp. NBC_01491 TaxID=2976007 RepID=UPI002E36BEA1|nr:hypothetical protein [Spirillospora sp. NBC_01491]
MTSWSMVRPARPDTWEQPPPFVALEARVLEHLALETAQSDPLTAARILFWPHESQEMP